jgi:capsular polysaccharide biosynthesis protein
MSDRPQVELESRHAEDVRREAGGLRHRRVLVVSLVAGALTAGLVVAGGLAFAATRPVRWSASASAVVLPARGVDPDSVAGFYETLSRGQVVETFAQILRLQRFEADAVGAMGLAPADRRAIDVDVQVVPSTAVIRVSTTASRRELAEEVTDRILALASDYIAGLGQPYTFSIVDDADGSAARSGPPKAAFPLVAGLVALAFGLAAQQATFHLGRALAGRGIGPRKPVDLSFVDTYVPAAGSEAPELAAAGERSEDGGEDRPSPLRLGGGGDIYPGEDALLHHLLDLGDEDPAQRRGEPPAGGRAVGDPG